MGAASPPSRRLPDRVTARRKSSPRRPSVGQGFVDSLARPGGNATGLTFFEFSVIGKMLDALKQIAPAVSRVVLAFNPDSLSNPPFLRAIEAAAPTLAELAKTL
jgi:hypothetical protein